MTRPAQFTMRALPVLEGRRDALEKCVFCPKLCRSACPVSNAEPSETLTPWGKMSTAYFLAQGDVPATESFARTSLARPRTHPAIVRQHPFHRAPQFLRPAHLHHRAGRAKLLRDAGEILHVRPHDHRSE